MYRFLLLPKYVRNTWPWDVLFSHTFPVLSSLSPCFGDNTTDVKTNKFFLFLIPFSHKCLCEIFTKELNLFCSWARPSISIFNPFVIEVRECVQYRRAGSVFYSSVSNIERSKLLRWKSWKNLNSLFSFSFFLSSRWDFNYIMEISPWLYLLTLWQKKRVIVIFSSWSKHIFSHFSKSLNAQKQLFRCS